MSDVERLLDVQDHDTRIDQLNHRHESMPERQAVQATKALLAELAARRAELDAQRSEIGRQEKRLEDEVSSIEEHATSVDRSLYAGGSNPRELQALTDELASLKRRQRHLEDEVIELMEALEPLDGQASKLQAETEALEAQLATQEGELAHAEGDLVGELATEQAARASAVEGIDAGLLAEYEQLRRTHGGLAVARLSGATCGGCHLTLAAAEVSRLRKEPADALVHCYECGRLLVR